MRTMTSWQTVAQTAMYWKGRRAASTHRLVYCLDGPPVVSRESRVDALGIDEERGGATEPRSIQNSPLEMGRVELHLMRLR